MTGERVQVLFVDEDGTYRLDETALRRVAEHEAARGLPVAVASVAGATRGGKSFLLDFFLRYLRAPEAARHNGDWLGADHDPLTGFSWRGGCDRDTQGILLWSEPIVVTLGPEENNEKVAVVLMDTQGTFDSSSTIRDSSTVFALSTLVASVQIFNLSQNIKEDDLQYLQLFTEYGKLARVGEVDCPFQTLQFLVRDWSYAYQHPIGSVGGQQLLDKRLEIRSDQHSELREIRQHVRSVFETVRCFLLPHPGLTVATSPDFRGCLYDITPEFKNALLDLVPSLLGPENLTLKMVNGQKVALQDLPNYFKTYIEIFNSDTLPTPTTVMQATSLVSLEVIARASRKAYCAYMEGSAGGGSLPRAALPRMHAVAQQVARDTFAAKKTLAAPAVSAARLEVLLQELDALLPNYVVMNNGKIVEAIAASKAAYDDAIQESKICYTTEELAERQSDAVAAAMAVLLASRAPLLHYNDGDKKNCGEQDEEEENEEEENEEEDEDWTALEKELADLWPLCRQKNKERIECAHQSAHSEYMTHMRAGFATTPCLHIASLTTLHNAARSAAETVFVGLWMNENPPLEEVKKLHRDLEPAYTRFEEENRVNNERMVDEVIQLYTNQMAEACNGEDGRCLHPKDLMSHHERALNSADSTFRERQGLATRPRADEHHQSLNRKIAQIYLEFEERNETRNKEAVKSAHEYYLTTIAPGPQGFMELFDVGFEVVNRHNTIMNEALRLFHQRRHPGGDYSEDLHLDDLKKKIQASYRWLLVRVLGRLTHGNAALMLSLLLGGGFTLPSKLFFLASLFRLRR